MLLQRRCVGARASSAFNPVPVTVCGAAAQRHAMQSDSASCPTRVLLAARRHARRARRAAGARGARRRCPAPWRQAGCAVDIAPSAVRGSRRPRASRSAAPSRTGGRSRCTARARQRATRKVQQGGMRSHARVQLRALRGAEHLPPDGAVAGAARGAAHGVRSRRARHLPARLATQHTGVRRGCLRRHVCRRARAEHGNGGIRCSAEGRREEEVDGRWRAMSESRNSSLNLRSSFRQHTKSCSSAGLASQAASGEGGASSAARAAP